MIVIESVKKIDGRNFEVAFKADQTQPQTIKQFKYWDDGLSAISSDDAEFHNFIGEHPNFRSDLFRLAKQADS